MSRHAGEVSFPGGAREKDDRDATHTALREAHEELGVESAAVRVLGQLDDLPTITDFRVTPVVGALVHEPIIRPNAAEVADWFWVDLTLLRDEKNWRSMPLPWRGNEITTWFFEAGKHLIWGATAHMVRDLLVLIEEGQKGWTTG